MQKLLVTAFAAICAVLIGAGAAKALPSKPQLTVEVAEKAAVACYNYGEGKGWKLNVAVLDAGGGLLYFRRNPDAYRGSVDISINKAWTATQFGFPTRLFGEVIVKRAEGIQYTPRLIIFPGGLPIKAGEALIGGIGVSGATGDQDEECAQAGLDAIKDQLK